MHTFTHGLMAIEGLLGTRTCLVLVLVFVSSIDRSSSSDVAPESTRDAPSFRKPETLTNEQRKSVVTIEFNFKHIDSKNRTAVNAAYREVRKKILEYLNRRKSTTVPPTYTITTAPYTTTAVATTTISTTITPFTTPTTLITTTTPTAQTTTAAAPTTTATTSVVETTTETTTTLATTTSTTQAITTTPITTTKSTTTTRGVPPNKKRRRKRSQTTGENDVIYTEEDLLLIENEPEIDENGILRISLLLDKDGLNGTDFDELLYKAVEALNGTGALDKAAGAPVVKIDRGLPPKVEAAPLADYRVWLPILLAIVLLLIISTFVCCWLATNKKVKNDESKKIVPKLDSKPNSTNGHVPRILDDNRGWLVPYEEFSYEQK